LHTEHMPPLVTRCERGDTGGDAMLLASARTDAGSACSDALSSSASAAICAASVGSTINGPRMVLYGFRCAGGGGGAGASLGIAPDRNR
jgi:hypothetical protein